MRAPERLLLAAAAALALAAPLGAQPAPARPAANAPDPAPAATLPEEEVYRREVFRYQPGGRPDPFQPLLNSEDMGMRAQDLRLVSIIYSSNPRAAMAVFALPDSSQRVRLRVGQRLGAVTVVAIHPRRVDLREDAFGATRMYSQELVRTRTPVPVRPGAPAPAPQAAPAQPAPARPNPRR